MLFCIACAAEQTCHNIMYTFVYVYVYIYMLPYDTWYTVAPGGCLRVNAVALIWQ